MASVSLDQNNPSISQHRAFPAVVALWFAALLGFGTMMMPAILLERGAQVTGLASVVPAAAPPLGATAHLLAGIAAGLAGAVMGLVLARQLAAAHRRETPAPTTARALLNPREDFDDETFDHPLLRDHSGPVAADVDLAPDFPVERSAPEPIGPALASDDADGVLDQFPPASPGAERRRMDRRAGNGSPAPGNLERRVFLRRADDEPLPFVAPSLARPAPDNENTPELAIAGQDEPSPAPRELPPTPSWLREPLEDLSLVQLVERLGASLAHYRQRAVRPKPLEAPVPAPFQAADPDEAARAMATYFGRPSEPAEADPDAEDLSDGPDAPFGSLLEMRAPAGLDDTDETLRRALATLQKLSGTN